MPARGEAELKTSEGMNGISREVDEFARPDRAGGWIIPLGEERRTIGDA